MNSDAITNFRSPLALARFLLTASAGVIVDLWTKHQAFARLGPDEEARVIPGWLHFKITTNPGAVFGFGEGQHLLFIAVSVAAIIFLFYLYAQSQRQWFYQLVLGMLLAGVVGNMYDRLAFGHVRDMIYALPQWPSLFPWIFNVADVLLCTGVGLMVLYSLFQSEPRKQPSTAEGPGLKDLA